jgi:hypothetical protein
MKPLPLICCLGLALATAAAAAADEAEASVRFSNDDRLAGASAGMARWGFPPASSLVIRLPLSIHC